MLSFRPAIQGLGKTCVLHQRHSSFALSFSARDIPLPILLFLAGTTAPVRGSVDRLSRHLLANVRRPSDEHLGRRVLPVRNSQLELLGGRLDAFQAVADQAPVKFG